MEAPDKIYVPTADDELHYHMTCPNNEFQESIEYVRTDAFIEKVCEWLKENFSFDDAGYCKTNIYSTKSMIYNFKNTLEL